MPGIKRLKSRAQPPWGGILVGILAPAVESITNRSINVNVRFFTPGTATELGRAIAGAYEADSHLTDDTTNIVTSANASDQATANTLLNEMKADYNAHIASTTFHVAADGTNTVTSANASSLATSITLANEMKADFNAHRSQSGVHTYDDISRSVLSADASDLATVITLANDIKARYNAHRPRALFKFTVYGVMPGTYDIGAKVDFALSKKVSSQVIAAGGTTVVSFGVLMHGDVNLNALITTGDATFVSQMAGNVIGDNDLAGDYAATDDWRVPLGTAYGVWSAVPTARRRTY